MELVQSRIVTDDVELMANFYAALVGVSVVSNEYYVEVPTGAMSIGFSKPRFTEDHRNQAPNCAGEPARRGETILDFAVDDVDAEFERIDAARGRLGPAADDPAVGHAVHDLPGSRRPPRQRLLSRSTGGAMKAGSPAVEAEDLVKTLCRRRPGGEGHQLRGRSG